MPALLLLMAFVAGAHAAKVPSREIPPSVLVELQRLENRFELALAADCDADRCFSKGCTYVDHAVADQPRSGSLPGLGQESGPGSGAPQEYLTRARCSFAHEQGLESKDVQALVRRLQAKLSSGWTVVTVDHQALQPLPAYLREPPTPEPAATPEVELEDPAPTVVPEEWTVAAAGHELWTTLLPHFFWMVGLGLATLAGALMIWTWRRVGRESLEEQLLLAQMAAPESDPSAPPEVVTVAEDDDAQRDYVRAQDTAWRLRLEQADAADPELHALIRELLRAGDMALLAKAVLRFPDRLPAVFPSGGDIAAAKLALADYLKTVDEAELPSDVVFFESLNRHALAATLAAQPDTRIVRSLREDFGAAGLVDLIGRLPARQGALLFALAPLQRQREVVRLLQSRTVSALSAQLLLSDRMDPGETERLFEVLSAAPGAPMGSVADVAVSDRGASFDAAGALSVLLPRLDPAQRAGLFEDAIQRFRGRLPEWVRGVFYADLLLTLDAEARADLLLEVDPAALSAWLSMVDAELRGRVLAGVPDSLRVAVGAGATLPSGARLLALAIRGRRELALGLQRILARTGTAFERVVAAQTTGDAR